VFGAKKGNSDDEGLAAPDVPVSREVTPDQVTPDRVSPQREAWRRAAQSVTRTWSEWSAADSRRRSELYRRYTSALDEEEQAAATLERLLTDDARTEVASSVHGSCG
jgi:hypothetical protein